MRGAGPDPCARYGLLTSLKLSSHTVTLRIDSGRLCTGTLIPSSQLVIADVCVVAKDAPPGETRTGLLTHDTHIQTLPASSHWAIVTR